MNEIIYKVEGEPDDNRDRYTSKIPETITKHPLDYSAITMFQSFQKPLKWINRKVEDSKEWVSSICHPLLFRAKPPRTEQSGECKRNHHGREKSKD